MKSVRQLSQQTSSRTILPAPVAVMARAVSFVNWELHVLLIILWRQLIMSENDDAHSGCFVQWDRSTNRHRIQLSHCRVCSKNNQQGTFHVRSDCDGRVELQVSVLKRDISVIKSWLLSMKIMDSFFFTLKKRKTTETPSPLVRHPSRDDSRPTQHEPCSERQTATSSMNHVNKNATFQERVNTH